MIGKFWERLRNLFTGCTEKELEQKKSDLLFAITEIRTMHANQEKAERAAMADAKAHYSTKLRRVEISAEYSKRGEEESRAKLKECRAILREHGLGHLYPGADPDAEKEKAAAGMFGPGSADRQRALIVAQHDVAKYKKSAELWEEYSHKLEVACQAAGIPYTPACIGISNDSEIAQAFLDQMIAEENTNASTALLEDADVAVQS